jgi:hypothetical protein
MDLEAILDDATSEVFVESTSSLIAKPPNTAASVDGSPSVLSPFVFSPPNENSGGVSHGQSSEVFQFGIPSDTENSNANEGQQRGIQVAAAEEEEGKKSDDDGDDLWAVEPFGDLDVVDPAKKASSTPVSP